VEPLSAKDPKSIGEYTLVGRLGSGGMGTVYVAVRQGEMVAIKSADFFGGVEQAEKSRFEREVANQQMLRSPFIAHLIDSGIEEGRAWIAMEYVSGQNLSSLLTQKSSLSESLWWSLALACASAIATTSQAGIIHRDVKPANISLSSAGPKLVDFGIARNPEETSITVSGSITGSPAWLTPEQLDDSEITPAVDVFALAAVLWFCKKGNSPWGTLGKSSSGSFMKAVLDSDPSFEGFGKEESELLAPMFRKNPSERPSALEVGASIRRLAEDRLSLYFSLLEIYNLAKARSQ
jgi:serine/threonine protein kinase